MSLDLSNDENGIVDKRYKTLLGIWDKVSRSPYFVDNSNAIYHLNESLLGVVVAHYICDLKALKMRYGIDGKIQFPKIAGLMTNAIAKYKPLVPRAGNNNLQKTLEANEIFAVFYGLCVLFDVEILPDGDIKVKVGETVKEFIETPLGLKWRKNMHYLLNSRNYTAEGLIAVFETLCITLAPELLGYESKG
jgi:hypothetical protein